MIYSLCFPPGMEPWASKYSPLATSLLLLHHGCGLLGAFPTCLLFSHEPCFRWAAFILMAGPFPMLIMLVADALFDHTTLGGAWAHLLLSGTNFFLTYYLRVTLLTPVAAECILRGRERGGEAFAALLRGAYCCISLINGVIVFTLLKTFLLALLLEGWPYGLAGEVGGGADRAHAPPSKGATACLGHPLFSPLSLLSARARPKATTSPSRGAGHSPHT